MDKTLFLKTGSQIEFSREISPKFIEQGGFPKGWPFGTPIGYIDIRNPNSTEFKYWTWEILSIAEKLKEAAVTHPTWHCALYKMTAGLLYKSTGPFSMINEPLVSFLLQLPCDAVVMSHVSLFDEIQRQCKHAKIGLRHHHFCGVLKTSYLR